MSLNIEGGLSRLVRGLRLLAKVWWWGCFVLLALYLGLSKEFADGGGILAIAAVGLAAAAFPAACAMGLAWLLAGFLEPKR